MALHDLVNVELGKPVWDKRNLVDFAAAHYSAAEEVLGMHVDKPVMGRGVMPMSVSARDDSASVVARGAVDVVTLLPALQ